MHSVTLWIALALCAAAWTLVFSLVRVGSRPTPKPPCSKEDYYGEVWLSETAVAKLKKLSAVTGAPMAELFRRAVEAFVSEQIEGQFSHICEPTGIADKFGPAPSNPNPVLGRCKAFGQEAILRVICNLNAATEREKGKEDAD
jgi:hypothetical protein